MTKMPSVAPGAHDQQEDREINKRRGALCSGSSWQTQECGAESTSPQVQCGSGQI